MSQHAFTLLYVDVPSILCLAVVFLWLKIIRVSLRKLLAQAALTVTGYLRPRPDPSAEHALRAAFTDLDKELAEILGGRAAGLTGRRADPLGTFRPPSR